MEHRRTAIGIGGITARPPQRGRQAGRQAVIPPDVARPVLDAYQMSRVGGPAHQALRGAASSNNNSSSRAPVSWALYALHENEAAVAVRGLVDLPRQPAPAAFWWSFRRWLLFGQSPGCVGACPNRPFSARGTALSGRELCSSMPGPGSLGAQQPAFAPELCRRPR